MVEGRSSHRALFAVLLFAAPLVSLTAGLLAIVIVPAAAAYLGPEIWPGRTRGQAALLGVVVLIAGVAGLVGAVFWTYGLCAPDGAIAIVPPAAGLLTYAVGCALSLRRQAAWLWPLAVLTSLVVWGVLGIALVAADVQFTC